MPQGPKAASRCARSEFEAEPDFALLESSSIFHFYGTMNGFSLLIALGRWYCATISMFWTKLIRDGLR
jgi:hypothetical protein